MKTNATFNEVLDELLRSASEAHDNGEELQGQSFADERGWLSSDQRLDMRKRMARADVLERQIDACMQALCRDHAQAWSAYIDVVIRSFRAVVQGLESNEGEPPTEAERQLAEMLFGAWEEMRKGKAGGYGVSWTVQAGVELAARWSPVGQEVYAGTEPE